VHHDKHKTLLSRTLAQLPGWRQDAAAGAKPRSGSLGFLAAYPLPPDAAWQTPPGAGAKAAAAPADSR